MYNKYRLFDFEFFLSACVDPPEQVSVSPLIVDVKEGQVPGQVTCVAKGFPEPSYSWRYGDEVVSNSAVLFLDHPLSRDQAGEYECVAENRHGNISTRTKMNVQCK